MSSLEIWDPETTDSNAEMICTGVPRQATLSGGAVKDMMLDFLAGLRKWTVCRLSQCSSVRSRSRGCDTVLQRSETTPLREEQEMGQLHQCGRLVMFASEIFLFPLNIFKCLTFASCYQLNYCLSDSLSSCSQLKVFSFSVISFLPLSLLSSWR